MRRTRIPALCATAGAGAVLLASCSGHPASGTFVAKKGDAITLVDLVEGEHGQVVGRLEAASVKPDGTFSDQGGSVSGQRDGGHLHLALSMGLSSAAATGELHGSSLSLNGPGFSTDFSKSNPETFQKAVAELRAKSVAITAQRAKAEADAAAERARAQANAAAAADRAQSMRADQGLAAQADTLVSRLSRAETTLSGVNDGFAQAAKRVEQAVAAVRSSHASSVYLGQMSVAISQRLVQMEQQHIQLDAGEQSLGEGIQQQLNADAAARGHCAALGNADTDLNRACGDLLSQDQKLRAAIPALRSAMQATEAAYAKGRTRIEAAQHEVDDLAQRAG